MTLTLWILAAFALLALDPRPRDAAAARLVDRRARIAR
jgi:hypothetical protein